MEYGTPVCLRWSTGSVCKPICWIAIQRFKLVFVKRCRLFERWGLRRDTFELAALGIESLFDVGGGDVSGQCDPGLGRHHGPSAGLCGIEWAAGIHRR